MTQPAGSKGKRALSSEGQDGEVKTASGAFQRVELQWKDVNYTVREGNGKKAVVKKVCGLSNRSMFYFKRGGWVEIGLGDLYEYADVSILNRAPNNK